MIERYRDGVVPDAEPDPALTGGEGGLAGMEGRVAELLDRTELTQALEEIWVRVRRLNRYVEECRPWDLAKKEKETADPVEPGRPRTRSGAGDRLDVVLYSLAEGLRVVSLLLHAYMPETGDRMLTALGEEGTELAELGSRPGGQRIERLPPLFPKIETASET